MKIEITETTLTTLNNLRGKWLLKNGELIVIRDFQYIQENPVADPVPANTKRRKRRKKKDESPKLYLTAISIESYNNGMKFMGNYNEEYCEALIDLQNSTWSLLSLRNFRVAWIKLEEQIEAMTEYEAELKAQGKDKNP